MLWVVASVIVLLNSFETPTEVAKAQPNQVRLERVSQHASHGQYALRAEFQVAPYPSLVFRLGQGFSDGDWRPFGGLALDVANPDDEPITLHLRVDDDPAADGQWHSRTGRAIIPPKSQVTAAMPFRRIVPLGMRGGLPMLPNSVAMTTYGAELDYSRIVAFQIFLANLSRPRVLFIDNLRLIPTLRGKASLTAKVKAVQNIHAQVCATLGSTKSLSQKGGNQQQ
jgi:hypothetical protein